MKAEFNVQREMLRKVASRLYVTRYVEELEDTFNDSNGYSRMPIVDKELNELFININKADINILVMFRESENSKPCLIKTSVKDAEGKVISKCKSINLDWNTTDDLIDAIYASIGRCYCISR